MKQIPNLLTLGNLFCGVLAILFTLHTPVFISNINGQDFLVQTPPEIYWASIFIGIAAICDFLDGFAARLLGVNSPMGEQLDSLADLVTFGVAPGMILYHFLSVAYMQQPNAMGISLLAILPALLLPCFTAYRLARFNTYQAKSSSFTGIPAPAVGILIASFPLVKFYEQAPFSHWLSFSWLLYLILALCCFLMVSNIPFFSFKVKNLSWKDNALRYLLVFITLISIPFLQWTSIAFCIFLYIILSLGKFCFVPNLKDLEK